VEKKNKMADEIKMTAKNEFSRAQSIYANQLKIGICKIRKYKTVVGSAILNHSSILKFGKKVTSTIFFYELMFSNPKFQMI
jgi:hypothetical protein